MKAPPELSPGGPLSGGNAHLPQPEPVEGALPAQHPTPRGPPHTPGPTPHTGAHPTHQGPGHLWAGDPHSPTVPTHKLQSGGSPGGPWQCSGPRRSQEKVSAGNRASTQQETRSRETPRPPGPQPAGSRHGQGAAGCSSAPSAAKQAHEHPRGSTLNGGKESRTKTTSLKTSQ